jgi:hypothetical protein
MSGLFWNSSVRTVTDSTPIGQVKRAIGDRLVHAGYSDVRVDDAEVAGGKGNSWVSVADFPLGGARFQEVVMASGNTGEEARRASQEAVELIRGLRFFD